MKKLTVLFLAALLLGCSEHTPKQQASTANPDSLAAQLKDLKEQYRPELGEIMLGIQTHHAKLWFAGINNNWKLANYEMDEIKERIEVAAVVETDRPEVKTISMIYPALDSVANSIKQQNLASFKNNFQVLTNTCNSCHTANHFEFNVITIPTAPPVYNQDFKTHAK